MSPDEEQRIAAQLARLMAAICVRNSRLEDLHAGRVPVSRAQRAAVRSALDNRR